MIPLYLYSFAHSIPRSVSRSFYFCLLWFEELSSNEDREPHAHIRSSLGSRLTCSQRNERRVLVQSRSSFSVLVVVESLAC